MDRLGHVETLEHYSIYLVGGIKMKNTLLGRGIKMKWKAYSAKLSYIILGVY